MDIERAGLALAVLALIKAVFSNGKNSAVRCETEKEYSEMLLAGQALEDALSRTGEAIDALAGTIGAPISESEKIEQVRAVADAHSEAVLAARTFTP